MPILRDMQLLPVSVQAHTGFPEAVRKLLTAHTSAIAVVDDTERVIGLFTDDDLLRGLFPRYLGELRHTAFLVNEGQPLSASIDAVAGEPVSRYMRKPVTVEIEASAAHVVERFLHTPWGAPVAAFVPRSGRSTTGAVISTRHDLGTMPFAWRIFAVNAVLLVAAAIALALSPATVSFPIALTEGIVLAIGLVAILIINLLLVRRSFAPLERLTRLMRSVDLLRPGQRVEVTGPQEVRELGAVFNEMLERRERERHESGWGPPKT